MCIYIYICIYICIHLYIHIYSLCLIMSFSAAVEARSASSGGAPAEAELLRATVTARPGYGCSRLGYM